MHKGDTDPLPLDAYLRDDSAMNTTGTVSERLRQLDVASRSDNTTAQPALRILGHVAEQHLIAVVAALEEHYAGHSELRAIEETLARLETEVSPVAGSQASRSRGRRRA